MNVKTVKTPELQGDDSWVKIKRPTVGQIEELMKRTGKVEDLDSVEDKNSPEAVQAVLTSVEFTREMVSGFVLDWNWVDDAGEPLPNPFGNPEVVKLLTDAELSELVKMLTIDAEDVKKKK